MSKKLSIKIEGMSHNEKAAYADALKEKLSFSDTCDLINMVRLREGKKPFEYSNKSNIIHNYKSLYKINFFDIDYAKDSIKDLIHEFEDVRKQDAAKHFQNQNMGLLNTVSKKTELSKKEKRAYLKALRENLSFLDTCELINETRMQEQKEAFIYPHKNQIINNYIELYKQNFFDVNHAKIFIRKIRKEHTADVKRHIARRKYNERKMNGWDEIRRKILLRDNSTCQICGSKTKLHVHHIVPFSIVNCHEADNLVTLCDTCHHKIHSIHNYYGLWGSKIFVKKYINLCKQFNIKVTLEQDAFNDFFDFTYEAIP
jgi:5-methylcytosine-specific restriction endonuclease McrA